MGQTPRSTDRILVIKNDQFYDLFSFNVFLLHVAVNMSIECSF